MGRAKRRRHVRGHIKRKRKDKKGCLNGAKARVVDMHEVEVESAGFVADGPEAVVTQRTRTHVLLDSRPLVCLFAFACLPTPQYLLLIVSPRIYIMLTDPINPCIECCKKIIVLHACCSSPPPSSAPAAEACVVVVVCVTTTMSIRLSPPHEIDRKYTHECRDARDRRPEIKKIT